MKSSKDLILAVDIGGTKFETALVGFDGNIYSSKIYRTLSTINPERLYRSIFEAATKMLPENTGLGKVKFCSIGCGGPMDKFSGHISPINIVAFRSFPLVERLKQDLNMEVFIDNDAKALTLAEKWLGGAINMENFMSMVVSTGIGGGIYLDGKLLDGRSGNCGHIGHVNVVTNGHECGCSARGCLEAEASGTAIRNIYKIDPKDAPRKLRVRTGHLVGKAVGSVFNLLDLKCVFVAGSVALGYGGDFFSSAQSTLARTCRLDFTKEAVIVPSALNDRGPILGAAAVGLFEQKLIDL